MAITKQKYIIGSTLQTPTPWNRNLGFISSGAGASFIVTSFQTRVATNNGTFESFSCAQNTIQSLLNIDLAP